MRHRRDRRRGIRGAIATAIAAVVLTGCVLGETGDARYVADDAATLIGTLLSTQNGSARFWFEYGTTTSYGESTPELTSGVAQGARQPVSVRVDGLQPATTYHYRLCGVDDDADPQGACGADRTFSTGSGRESVSGDGTIVIDAGRGASAAVTAAADPDSAGYLDGDATIAGYFPGPPPAHHRIFWGGGGGVSCLRIEGNVAVAGFDFNDPILGLQHAALVIEDNGPTGDRFDLLLLSPGEPCPQPDASRIGSGFVAFPGAVTSGGFNVDDG
jgi:hypothetical protein